MRFWKAAGAPATEENAIEIAPDAEAYTLSLPAEKLKWELSTSGLTTQYKSFYFAFDDGSAGYFQLAYGNLGLLVKVAPMGWSFYKPGHEPIVGSQTLHASSMQVSSDQYSVTVGNHSLHMRADGSGWHAILKDAAVTFDLEFTIESECFAGHDLGIKTSRSRLRHCIIPSVSARGSVTAHGETVNVKGYATHYDAMFTHIKFTDLCNSFVNFHLRTPESKQVLTLLQYVPRGLEEQHQISQGSYTEDGKVVAILMKNMVTTSDPVKHAASGYMIPRATTITWSGRTLDGRDFSARVELELQEPSSVTDVLSIFPSFFKDIVKIWAGLPFVFCWRLSQTKATITIDGKTTELEGVSSTELTNVHMN